MQQQLSPIRKKPQLQTEPHQKQARADNKAGHEAFLQARISRSSGFPQKRACVGSENLRQLCQRLQIRFGSSELPAADALARDMEPVRQLLLGQTLPAFRARRRFCVKRSIVSPLAKSIPYRARFVTQGFVARRKFPGSNGTGEFENRISPLLRPSWRPR